MNIYKDIEQMHDMNHNDMYDKLVKLYPKKLVKFAMYDKLNFVHEKTTNIYQRNDKKFRHDVLARYNNECVITHSSEAVEVCHIKPFAKCNEYEKYDVNNGIVLRCDLHKLFDDGKLIINPETMTVIFSEQIMSNKKNADYHKYNNTAVAIDQQSRKYFSDCL